MCVACVLGVNRSRTLCQKLESVYGPRPNGCVLTVAADSAAVFPSLDKLGVKYLRPCEDRFWHTRVSTHVSHHDVQWTT